ncbi:DNA-binding protein [Parapedobacter pyrenivorans]|uniref:DNA-binding protein n=1 Tax=Parapedobacter pyrenivorans TaxID=1305674 RepID=A0A917MAF8_9SPHI|nr:GyrI-like domain-containing protein [Parapedobacter pyrenivorans]GGG88045.1 DNA-binding protein [Parapedobacter pyrenivorans]
MNKVKIEPFKVIGISVRTTNENNQAAADIPNLWGKFLEEGVLEKIPYKVDNTVYCLYTDYEKDHTLPYTTILGCKVTSLENIPTGMVGKDIEGIAYEKFTVRGNLQHNIVFNEWIKIWNADLPRLFSTDFEIYGVKAQNPSDAEVDILIAVK